MRRLAFYGASFGKSLLIDKGYLPKFAALEASHFYEKFIQSLDEDDNTGCGNQLAGVIGALVKKKYIDYTFVTDERICDGFYFASGLKLFRAYLANPSILDVPPKEVINDIE